MIKGFFKKSQKPAAKPASPAPGLVDEDETIVIDLTGGGSEKELETPEIVLEIDEVTEEAAVVFESGAPDPAQDDDETIVVTAADVRGDSAAQSSNQTDHNLAGWICATSGASTGRSFAITMGQNRIGRGEDNQVRLDLDDEKISKSNHLSIAADPKTEKFYVVPGDSQNLAYLNGAPILQPKDLSDRDAIQIGTTEFIFVQFYGNYVAWR